MSRSTIVLKSFAELADVLDLGALPAGPADVAAEEPTPATLTIDPPTEVPTEAEVGTPADPPADLSDLLAELEAAGATLATIARQDQETRAAALRDLEHYDALVARQREAEEARDRAATIRQQVEAFAASAFTAEAQATAAGVLEVARRSEAQAAALAEQRRQEAERLAAQLDLGRLLAERQRQEEAEKAKAAEAERAGRLSGALSQARAALESGRLEEARAVLGTAANENPDNAEIASLLSIIAQRERIVKVDEAEDALWAARREWRRDPAAAVERLQALDTASLPEPLARQVFGAWAQACARLCRERGLAEPLRYAPDPGRGAVIAREQPGAPYTVVAALGMGGGWRPGSPVGERQVARARPLR